MPIIDVHTHVFTRRWLELLRERGKPYGILLTATPTKRRA